MIFYCDECGHDVAEADMVECVYCHVILCEGCYNEYHSKCESKDEDFGLDIDYDPDED